MGTLKTLIEIDGPNSVRCNGKTCPNGHCNVWHYQEKRDSYVSPYLSLIVDFGLAYFFGVDAQNGIILHVSPKYHAFSSIILIQCQL